MYASLATPFASFPAIGNQQPTDLRARKKLKNWLKDGKLKGLESEMDRLLYSGKNKKLPIPAFNSIGLPYGGYYVQRLGWTSDDLYLFMRSSRNSVGHNHHDNNNIQLAAYGTWLLLDSGSPAYWAKHLPQHQKKYVNYFGEAGIGNVFMSNSLAVDGLGQGFSIKKLSGPTAGWKTPRKNLLHFSKMFDLTEGVYDGWYKSEKPISDTNMKDLLNDHGMDEIVEIIAYNNKLKHNGKRKLHAKHRRLVIFLRKEKFWVLVDEVDGGSKFTQTWNFPPADKGLNTVRYFLAPKDEDIYYGKIKSMGYTPSQVRSDEKLKRIVSISHYRPNIGIMNFSATPVSYIQHYGDMFPFRGWQSFGIGGEKVPAVQMEGSWRGKDPMVTVLYPMKLRHHRAKSLSAGLEGFKNLSQKGISGFTYKKKKSLITIQVSRKVGELTIGQIKVTAKLLLVCNDGKDNINAIVLACKALKIDGKVQDISGENFEFSLKNGKLSVKAIKAPSGFRWQTNSKGQLLPLYK